MQKVRRISDVEKLKDDDSVYISIRLSKKLVTNILLRMPSLKRIVVPKSIKHISDPSVIRALESVGIRVVESGRGRGRPPKHSEETIKIILHKYVSGEDVASIALSTGVPARTVYHIIRKHNLRR